MGCGSQSDVYHIYFGTFQARACGDCLKDLQSQYAPNKAYSRRVPRRGAKVVKSKSKVSVGRTRG